MLDTLNGNGTVYTPEVQRRAEHLVEGLLEKHRKGVNKIVTEAGLDFYAMINSGFDVYDFQQDVSPNGLGSYPYYLPPYYRQSQKRGEVIPIYLDENQLRFLRDRHRKLCADNPFALAALENRVNYAVGEEGFKIKAIVDPAFKPKIVEGDIEAQRYVDAVQRVIDRWYDYNDLPMIQEWLVNKPDLDGDGLVRHFFMPNGLVIHRPVYAEHLRSPSGSAYAPHYSFGIETDAEDVINIIGYWIIENPIISWTPVFVPKKDVTHVKRHTDWAAKRGMPLFYSCEVLLRAAFDLLRAVVSTAVARAKFSVIRKFTNGIVKEAADKIINEVTNAVATDPTTGQSLNIERKPFGSVTNASANMEYEFPGSNLDAGVFEVALQMVLRACAARCQMPEWMFTADASNANFSSSLVAEAPSTKAFGKLQKRLLKVVATSKTRGRESMAWMQVQHAVNTGYLDPDCLKVVALSCEGPTIVVRDKQAEAITNQVYFQMGVKPKTMIQQENDIDPKQAKKMFEEEARDQIELQSKQQEIQAKMGQQATPGATPGVAMGQDASQGPQGAAGANMGGSPNPGSENAGQPSVEYPSTGLPANRAVMASRFMEDRIPGGKGDNRPDSDFDPEQLRIGTEHEMEHTNDKAIAKEIAKDHLTEDKDYYKKLKKIEEASSGYDYSCVYINLAKAHWVNEDVHQQPPIVKIRQMVSKIKDGDLYDGQAREDNTHITVKYGLHTDNPDKIKELVHRLFNHPVAFTLGKTSVFSNEKYDVVKIGVRSDDLTELNSIISKNLKNTDQYPDYKPHVTLACVRKGVGKNYTGLDDVDGCKFYASAICFSDSDGKQTYISLVRSGTDVGLESEHIPRHLMEEYNALLEHQKNTWLLEAGFTGVKHIHYQRDGKTVHVTQYWQNGKQIKAPSEGEAEKLYGAAKSAAQQQGIPHEEHEPVHITHREDLGHPEEPETYEKALALGREHEKQQSQLRGIERETRVPRQIKRELARRAEEYSNNLDAELDKIIEERAAKIEDDEFKQQAAGIQAALSQKHAEEQKKLEPERVQAFSAKLLDWSKNTAKIAAPIAADETGKAISRNASSLVAHTALERGSSTQDAVNTTLWLRAADDWYQNGVSSVVADAVKKNLNDTTWGKVAGKLVETLPFAQLTYLAYSAIRNPFKTLKAARDVTVKNANRRTAIINPPLGPALAARRIGSGIYNQAFDRMHPNNVREIKLNSNRWTAFDNEIKRRNPEDSANNYIEQLKDALDRSDRFPGFNMNVHLSGGGSISLDPKVIRQLIQHKELADSGFFDEIEGRIRDFQQRGVEQGVDFNVSPTSSLTHTPPSSSILSSGDFRNSREYTHPSVARVRTAIRNKYDRFVEEGIRPRSGRMLNTAHKYGTAFQNINNQVRRLSRQANGGQSTPINLSDYIPYFRQALEDAESRQLNATELKGREFPGLAKGDYVIGQLERVVDWYDMDQQLHGFSEAYIPTVRESKQLLESLIQQGLWEAGKTGIVTDTHGHKHRFINGVPAPLNTDVKANVGGTQQADQFENQPTIVSPVSDPSIAHTSPSLAKKLGTSKLDSQQLGDQVLRWSKESKLAPEYISSDGYSQYAIQKELQSLGVEADLFEIQNAAKALAGISLPQAPRELPKPMYKGATSALAHLLRTGSIADMKRNRSGSGENYIIEFEGGQKGIWKPEEGQIDARKGVISGDYWKRDIAIAELGHGLGADDLFPVTVARKIDGRHGSMQHWVEDSRVGLMRGHDEKLIDYNDPDDLARAATWDFLGLCTDRNATNWVLDKKDKLHLIDNSLLLPESHDKPVLGNVLLLREAAKRNMKVQKILNPTDIGYVDRVLNHIGFPDQVADLTKSRAQMVSEAADKGMTFGQLYHSSKIQTLDYPNMMWDWSSMNKDAEI